MNYNNEEEREHLKNNKSLKSLNYNNIKISKKKYKIKSENNNYPEIVEFKSQDNLIYLKETKPIQNLEPYIKKENKKIIKYYIIIIII